MKCFYWNYGFIATQISYIFRYLFDFLFCCCFGQKTEAPGRIMDTYQRHSEVKGGDGYSKARSHWRKGSA